MTRRSSPERFSSTRVRWASYYWILLVLLLLSAWQKPTQAFIWPLSSEEDSQEQAFDASSEEPTLYASQLQDIKVGGYLPNYRDLNLNQTVQWIDDLILFSLEVHSRGMVGGCCLNAEHYQAVQVAKENHNPNLRLWVTVGGQGRTKAWKQVCQDPKKRYKFMQSMIRLW
jgi:GH18 family chitinase